MTVGLPGAGIGGLFYLLAALLMPFRELARTMRGGSSTARWARVGEQFAHATGIAAGTWVTGWLIVAGASRLTAGGTIGGIASGAPAHVLDLLRPAQAVGTALMLVAIITIVAVAGRLLAPPTARASSADAIVEGAPANAVVRPVPLTSRPRHHSLTPSASHPAWRRRSARPARGRE